MSSTGPTRADRALVRLLTAVDALGDSEWGAEIRAGGVTAVGETPTAVTYAQLSGAITDAVSALAEADRWTEAIAHSDRAARYFMARRAELHPVAGASFDGLRAAAHQHDREGMADFVELLEDLFPAGRVDP